MTNDVDVSVTVNRDTALKSILDAESGGEHSFNLVRGNVSVRLDWVGETDLSSAEIKRRLDRSGALDAARAEGFLAGVFVSSLVSPSVEELYPEVDTDVDSEEIVRELEEVETARDAVDWIEDEYDDKYNRSPAHVSRSGPDRRNPYALPSMDARYIPPGWKRDSDSNYLVKK